MGWCLNSDFTGQLPLIASADVVVVGGGPAGIGAAVMAARAGAETLLVEQYGVPGGMAAVGEVQPFMPNSLAESGPLDRPVFTEWRDKIGAYLPDVWKNTRLRGKDYVHPGAAALAAEELLLEAGVKILYHHTLAGTLVQDRKIKRIALLSKSGFSAAEGKIFCDCSGDGDLAVQAGCGWDFGDGEKICQPMTTCFKVGGVRIPVDSKRSGQPADAMLGTDVLPPDGEIAEWNKRLQECFLRNRQSGRISAPRESLLYLHFCQDGTLHFNTTRVIGKNPLDGKELSEAEIMSRKQIREIFTCLKEEIPEFRDAWLVSMAPSIGVRESRHIHGLTKLTLEAFTARMRFPDAVARCNYPVDKHSGKGSGTQCFFMEKNSFYEIPYGCIVAADIDNLTLGGRLISVDSHIHASCRIMPCACSLGQAAGVAAAMAARQGTRPAELDGVQVRKELQSMGAFL